MSLEKELTACELSQALEVTAPYLRLRNVTEHKNGHIHALIVPDQPRYREGGNIAASEVGRHLALLGAIAISRKNHRSGRHYYLATAASLKGSTSTDPVEDRLNEGLTGIAYNADINSKAATAQCSLVSRQDHAQRLFELETEYQIISERAFSRMFKEQYDDSSPMPSGYSPYSELDALTIETLDFEHCSSASMFVNASECAGHFPNYPCLPVAILMGRLSRVAAKLYAHRTGSQNKYRVVNAEISAQKLAFAGQQLRFTARYESTHDLGQKFYCQVCDDLGEVFGDMQLTLTDVESVNL